MPISLHLFRSYGQFFLVFDKLSCTRNFVNNVDDWQDPPPPPVRDYIPSTVEPSQNAVSTNAKTTANKPANGLNIERQSRLQTPGSKLVIPTGRTALVSKIEPKSDSSVTKNGLSGSKSDLTVPKSNPTPPKRDASSSLTKRVPSAARPNQPTNQRMNLPVQKTSQNVLKNPAKIPKMAQNGRLPQQAGLKSTSPPVKSHHPLASKIAQNGKIGPAKVSQNGGKKDLKNGGKSEFQNGAKSDNMNGLTKLEGARSRLQKVVKEPPKNGALREPSINGATRDILRNGGKAGEENGGGSKGSSRTGTPTTRRKFQQER